MQTSRVDFSLLIIIFVKIDEFVLIIISVLCYLKKIFEKITMYIEEHIEYIKEKLTITKNILHNKNSESLSKN